MMKLLIIVVLPLIMFSVTKTADVIIDVNGSTQNLDSKTVPEELSVHHNNFKIKEYIDSVCMEMFTPWEPKLFMDVCID